MKELTSLIHRKPIIVHPDVTASQAARLLAERATGSLIVAGHDGNAVGIITDRDLACFALPALSGESLTVGQLMSGKLISLDEKATIDDALNLMKTHGIRRIPVVRNLSGWQKCIGIVTLDDIIADEAADIKKISAIIKRQLIQRSPRSEARRTQSLKIFLKKVSSIVGIPTENSEQIIVTVLSALVQRLSFVGGVHLLSQLPSGLQEDLLAIPPGPDRSITVTTLLTRLMEEYNLEESRARNIMINTFAALTELLDPGEIEHVKDQLPEEFRAYFVGTEKARSKLTAA